MAGTSVPRPGAGESPRRELIGSGPFLVLHGPGLRCKSVAAEIKLQCAAYGVATETDEIDNVARCDLANFPGLLVVLPMPTEDEQEVARALALLRSVARLIRDYRCRKPHGLTWLLAGGNRSFYQAGVVQIVGLRALMDYRELTKAHAEVCARHYIDPHEPPFDVFKPYLGPGLTLVPELVDDAANTLFTDLRVIAMEIGMWGVTGIRDVPRLRNSIEACRQRYENATKYKVLQRPVHGMEMNRLDFILHDPDFVPPDFEKMSAKGRKAARDAWNCDGARVWRDVEQELQKIVPTLGRPRGRGKTRGAQRALFDLYSNLRTLDNFMQHTNEADWPALS